MAISFAAAPLSRPWAASGAAARPLRALADSLLHAAVWAVLGICALVSAAAAAEISPQVVRIPLGDSSAIGIVAGVFYPMGEGPFQVMVYSHGRPGTEAERINTKLPDPRGFVHYWVRKGFAVVAPIRPGYGATGGADRENSGVRFDVFGNCWGRPDFARAAAAAAEAVRATVAWARSQAWADKNRIVLVGTSMGGLASVATAATNPDGVAGYINFAGGTGGHGQAAPEHSCGADHMRALMSTYGSTTHVPSLWLYAQNDSFWGADWPRAWHRAFANGGSDTRLVMTEALPNADGHQLLARGSRLWMPQVDRFLAELGF